MSDMRARENNREKEVIRDLHALTLRCVREMESKPEERDRVM